MRLLRHYRRAKRSEYIIDGEKTVCEFDNVEGSIDLSELLPDKISDEDYDRLKQTLDDMKEDGCDVAITSVKVDMTRAEILQKERWEY